MRQKIGYGLLIVSTIIWCGIFVVPFLDIDTAKSAGLATACFFVGEAAFYIGILLIGKEAWLKLKHYFSTKLKQAKDDEN
ncbi:transporter suffix domain-containing protein [Shewanella sp. 202IG2-18]|uniref:transporter suffix domain-containing protein n=1 Tax=Parashewanella hymeniacidonis TaxID=2807618 RepID=UPI00195FB69C|nr:transporter suffix domain-containing protein [Parashewanella hymeniacidonis]MBM7074022.1 transporter suffix domain-containing protein [Parashewanella hymeniacidonis]